MLCILGTVCSSGRGLGMCFCLCVQYCMCGLCSNGGRIKSSFYLYYIFRPYTESSSLISLLQATDLSVSVHRATTAAFAYRQHQQQHLHQWSYAISLHSLLPPVHRLCVWPWLAHCRGDQLNASDWKTKEKSYQATQRTIIALHAFHIMALSHLWNDGKEMCMCKSMVFHLAIWMPFFLS